MTREPQALAIGRSWRWPLFVFALVAAWTAYLAYVCLALQSLVTWPIAALMFLPWGVFFLVQAWRRLRDVFDRRAIVRIDDDGIADLRRSEAVVPWEDISQVRIARARGGTCLMVRFRDRNAALSHVDALGLPAGLARRILSAGDEWPVMLTSLNYRHATVLRTARAYIVRERSRARAAAA
ncbi:hypothetical protein [Tahibacter soli]|uniref:PH domain-containing protein n=1 Tax=Tahibacter soli TaxID=2983605 RepID=A0A9X4BJ34_9GAMM|nr:hypothetical protein [Tahibacter soli]MDC8015915.1 hypothetical protein [Tahibacter soli]